MNVAYAFATVLFSLGGAVMLAACADREPTRDQAGTFGDAGIDRVPSASCGVSSNCPRHNEICVRTPQANQGECVLPGRGGLCAPTGEVARPEIPDCFPGAQCQPVPRTQSEFGGMCSFTGTPGALFTVPGAPKIALLEPSPFNTYAERQAITFRWTPPAAQTADTTAVAVLMRHVPQRVGNFNRLSNPRDIAWIWSSTAPGGAAAGMVSLRAGHQGVRDDGSLGPLYAADTLPAGRYWWLTYTLRDGDVRATSDVFSFRVGADIAEERCMAVSDCTRLIPGESADLVACVYQRCRRRCASDLDCPGAGRRCAIETPLEPPDGGTVEEGIPRGAFCATR